MRRDIECGRLGVVVAWTVLLLLNVGCGSTTSSRSSSATPATGLAKAYDAATTAQFQKVLDGTRAQAGFPGVIAGVWSRSGTWIGTSGTKGKTKNGAPSQTDHTRIG